MNTSAPSLVLRFLVIPVLAIPLAAMADPKQDCLVAGRVFEEAFRSDVLQLAYGERTDWRRVDYYMLPKEMQDRIEADVVHMRPSIESAIVDTKKEIPNWKRQGMDGDHMAREILIKGSKGLGENYSINCLKELPSKAR